MSGAIYQTDDKKDVSIRLITDHIRSTTFMVSDGIMPSNEGRGYVLRRLIRRAVRHGRTLDLSSKSLLKIAEIYIDEIYKESYPLLTANKSFILDELKKEIGRFESTIENGMKEFVKILDDKKKNNLSKIDGKEAFYLYDTFGFPIELTVEMAEESGISVDEEGFKSSMEEQKQKARDNQNFQAKLSVSDAAVFDALDESKVSEFVGYDNIESEGVILALANEEGLADSLNEGQSGTIIVDKTPFYATMGGQKADIGVISAGGFCFVVEDVVKLPGNRIGHIGTVKQGTIKTADTVKLSVDKKNRFNTCQNHSATHLMQKALQIVLGDGVEQQGSYQDAQRTRFDFSYSKPMTEEEIARVEKIVNEEISKDIAVETKVMSLEDAKKTGAMALFGEKYADVVRVVEMGDFSKELCGGTHVKHTGEIRNFKVMSESGVAAGVRRIEAITGDNVIAYYKTVEKDLNSASAIVKSSPSALLDKLNSMVKELKELNSEIESLKAKAAKEALGDVLEKVTEVKGVKLLATAVPGVDMNGLRDLGDQLKAKLGEGVVVLISENDGKVSIVAMATDDSVKKGAHAGNLIKKIAPIVGGGGGGKPNMAQAGGKNPAGIADAVKEASVALEEQIG